MVCPQGLFHLQKNTDYPLSNLVADAETDLLSYFQSDREWSPNIFLHSGPPIARFPLFY